MSEMDRFHGWSRRASSMVLAVFAVLVAWGVISGQHLADGFLVKDPDNTDLGLYKAIANRIADGQGYYESVAVEHAARGYPTSPVMAVREPTLAWMDALLNSTAMLAVLIVLAVIALGLSIKVFDDIAPGRVSWMVASLIMALTLTVMSSPNLTHLHETWAAILVVIGLFALTVGRGGVTSLCLLAAAAIRELVAPILGLLVLLALLRRSRAIAVKSGAALIAFSGFYLWHAIEVSQISREGSRSAGWFGAHGWPFMTNALWFSTPLNSAPFFVAAIVVPLALLGWCSRRGTVPDAVSAVLVSYSIVFAVIGRWNNLYWGFLLGALLLPGLAFAPRALWTLTRNVSRALIAQ